MHLYLDDDTADRRLAALLTHAGHVVVVPASVQLSGAPDTQHFIHAMRQALVLVTRNHDDFLDSLEARFQTAVIELGREGRPLSWAPSAHAVAGSDRCPILLVSNG